MRPEQLSSEGYRFVGVLMNRSDSRWTEAALSDIAADIVRPADAGAAARELARCSVAIVSRLHAGILASLSGTPVISLEYQPKCRDFALSIDDERSLLRTDKLRASAVVDAVHGALADSSTIRTKTHAAVEGSGNGCRPNMTLWEAIGYRWRTERVGMRVAVRALATGMFAFGAVGR